MYAGLLHPARITLHQDANLVATGLLDPCDPSATIVEYNATQLNIYPNPATSELFIEIPFDAPNLEFYDLQGRAILLDVEQQVGTRKVDVQDLTPGIYMIRSGNAIARIVVE